MIRFDSFDHSWRVRIWFTLIIFNVDICLSSNSADTVIQKTRKLYQDTRTQRILSKLNDDLYQKSRKSWLAIFKRFNLGVGDRLHRMYSAFDLDCTHAQLLCNRLLYKQLLYKQLIYKQLLDKQLLYKQLLWKLACTWSAYIVCIIVIIFIFIFMLLNPRLSTPTKVSKILCDALSYSWMLFSSQLKVPKRHSVQFLDD